MADPTLVYSRLDALLTAIVGLDDHPEHADIGPWRWVHRQDGGGSVATWRHVDEWSRTVTIRPVTPMAVVVECPDGTAYGSYADEREAIDAAVKWMDANG